MLIKTNVENHLLLILLACDNKECSGCKTMVTVDITSHDRDKNKTILLLLFGSVFIQLASAEMCNSYECEKLNEGYRPCVYKDSLEISTQQPPYSN